MPAEVQSTKTNMLRLWDNLSDCKQELRLNSATQLVEQLILKQKAAGDGEETCEEVKYAVTRLVKGMASGRECIRVGFPTLLTELLKEFDSVTCEDVLSLVKQHLKIQGKKEEQKNCAIGRIFVYQCLIVSGKLQKDKGAHVEPVLAQLLELQLARPPLEPLVAEALVSLVSCSTERRFRKQLWPTLSGGLRGGWDACTPDTLRLLLACETRHPDVVTPAFVAEHWSHAPLTCEANFAAIAAAIARQRDPAAALHPFARDLVATMAAAATPDATFERFWHALVDDALFGDAVRKTRVAIAYCVVAAALAALTDETAERAAVVLSPRVVRALLRDLQHAGNTLHGAAARAADDVAAALSHAPAAAQVSAWTRIVGEAAPACAAHARLEETIARQMAPAAHDALEPLLRDAFLGRSRLGSGGAGEMAGQRAWAIERLQTIASARCARATRDAPAASPTPTIKFVLAHAFFDDVHDDGGGPSPPLDAGEHAALSRGFFKLGVWRATSREIAAKRNPMYELLQRADELRGSAAQTRPFARRHEKLWRAAVAAATDLEARRAAGERAGVGVALSTLVGYAALQLFVGPEEVEDSLSDILVCQSKAYEEKKGKGKEKKVKEKGAKKTKEGENEKEGEEPGWQAVLLDVVTGLLSRPKHLCKPLLLEAFRLLIPELTCEAVRGLVDVLNTSAKTAAEEEEDEDEEGGDMEAEEGSGDEEDEEESEEESDDDDDDDDDDAEVDEGLRAAVKGALGEAAAHSDRESEPDLDDDAMFRLDAVIADAFRSQKKSTKEEQRKAARELLHFKMRCLELLDMLAHSKATPATVLVDSLDRLLRVGLSREGATGGGEDAVAPERLATLVAAGVKTLRGASVETRRLASLLETARAAAAKTGPAAGRAVAGEIVSSLVDLVRASEGAAAGAEEGATEAALRTLLRDCYVGGRLPARLFEEAARGQRAAAWALREDLFALLQPGAARPFAQALVLRALVALLRQRHRAGDDGGGDAAEFLGRVGAWAVAAATGEAARGGGSSFARELVALLGVMARSSPPEGAAFWSDELAAAVVALFPSLPRKMRDQCFEAMQGPRVAAAWKDAVAEVRKSLKTGGKETGEKRIVKEKEQAGGESTEEEEAESATNEKKQKKSKQKKQKKGKETEGKKDDMRVDADRTDAKVKVKKSKRKQAEEPYSPAKKEKN